MRTKATILLIFLFIIAGGFYVAGQQWWGQHILPPEFSHARKQGSFVAEKIVFLTHQSLAGLEQIGGLDQQKKIKQSLELTTREISRNEEARQQAVLLSSHLGTMAAYLYQIEPDHARSLATEAIGHEVSLVNRLILFNDLLRQLFDLLQLKFGGAVVEKDQVQSLLSAINNEVRVINDLNQKFNATMEQFDEIFK